MSQLMSPFLTVRKDSFGSTSSWWPGDVVIAAMMSLGVPSRLGLLQALDVRDDGVELLVLHDEGRHRDRGVALDDLRVRAKDRLADVVFVGHLRARHERLHGAEDADEARARRLRAGDLTGAPRTVAGR